MVDSTTSEHEAAMEQRMHCALKAAWVHVNKPFTSNSAKTKVRQFAEVDSVAGHRVAMLFALQTAWTFVHASGDLELRAEISDLLGHGLDVFGLYLSDDPSMDCHDLGA